IICSSVKRLRFIPWSSRWARAYFKMDYFNGARSQRTAIGGTEFGLRLPLSYLSQFPLEGFEDAA
ncbi:hypothetical protein, partial [Rhizobium rhizogenes]|uniref:hypothetical protein n=1 Tax=Rhizobium rhizogenes TaxID=359 RepID=UPI001AEEDAF5